MRYLLSITLAVALLSSAAQAAPLTTTQSAAIAPIYSLTADTSDDLSAVVSSINRTLSFSRFDAQTGVPTGVSSTLNFDAGAAFLIAAG